MLLSSALIRSAAVVALLALTAITTRHDVDRAAYEKLAAQPSFAATAQVTCARKSIGTGVLVANRWVLTAAHLFEISDVVRFDTLRTPQGHRFVALRHIYERPDDKPERYAVEVGGRRYTVRRIISHPLYYDSLTRAEGDLALVELTQRVPDVKPAAWNTLPNELGAEVIAVGYGMVCRADQPDKLHSPRRPLAAQNVVDSVGDFKHQGMPTLLFADLDDPRGMAPNRLGRAEARPLEGTPNGGDSGSPLFRLRTGRWEVIGIYRGESDDVLALSDQLERYGYYGQLNEWTRVAPFAEWIKQEIARP